MSASPDRALGGGGAKLPPPHEMADYSDRQIEPEETWSRIEPQLSRFGITRLSRLTGLDRIGIPVWNAVSPNARSIVINQGKGIRDIDARVSAAMEALERSVAATPFPRAVRASLHQLRQAGKRPIALPGLIAAHETDPSDYEEMDWITGRDLLLQEEILVPMDAVCLDRTRIRPRYWQSSDGLASGNTPEEAIFHGLLERVERDAETLWYLRPLTARGQTAINPRDFADPVLDDLLDRAEKAGLRSVFFNMTSDTGIPCIMVFLAPNDILERQNLLVTEVTAGSGAHPVAVRAAIRAITECAQSRMTYISGARDDVDPEVFVTPLAADIHQSFALKPAPLPRWPTSPSGLSAMRDYVLQALVVIGCTALYSVSLSDPALPFAVEKVLAPGLENPDGARLRRFGGRAMRQALSI